MSERRKKIREHKIHARVWDAVREVWQDQRNERLEVDKLGIGIRSKVREIAADIAALEGEREDRRHTEGRKAGCNCQTPSPIAGPHHMSWCSLFREPAPTDEPS